MRVPLAHSKKGKTPSQTYESHIRAVVERSVANANAATQGKGELGEKFIEVVRAAAEVHDLGKLNEENQDVLGKESREALPVRHEDAGIAHLIGENSWYSAYLVAAHHAGLWDESDEANKDQQNAGHYLRMPEAFDDTAANLAHYVAEHKRVRPGQIEGLKVTEGPYRFGMRVALSCLVDADHGDTARNYGQEVEVESPEPRWAERIASLQNRVDRFGPPKNERDRLRGEFYRACAGADPMPPWRSCDAPVGSGKTLSIMAHLLRAAQAKGLRHIIVVLPYTNIIRQSVEEYREALALDGEDPTQVVAEHHHAVDFASAENRHLATLWRAPITVTTAVQFFETLASHHPSKLRKLHELPRSAVFLDETHACLPPYLWRVTWGWIEDWIENWQGHIVFGSGSLPEFWRSPAFVADTSVKVSHLVPEAVRRAMNDLERTRLRPQRHPVPLSLDGVIDLASGKDGPRLIILNTVHSAAVLAKEMRERGKDVLHLSTALTPKDREAVLDRVRKRLDDPTDVNWTLVATSCVEAGVDLSFRTAIRECASATSLIQTGGRVRRHLENWAGELWSVRLDDHWFKSHPGLRRSAEKLDDLFEEGLVTELEPSDLILEAWHRELMAGEMERAKSLIRTEEAANHRTLERDYRVIDADTRLVVVDPEIVARLRSREKISPIELIRHSVQIWAKKFQGLPISAIDAPQQGKRAELYAWDGDYEADFIGYMAGALRIEEFCRNGGAVA